MTDAEIVRACAEAMGWHWEVYAPGQWWKAAGWYNGLELQASKCWNPLTSNTDWAQVLDAFAKEGFRPNLGFGPTVGAADHWYLVWSPIGETYERSVEFYPTDEGRRRAVVVGFLKAKGLWKEEGK